MANIPISDDGAAKETRRFRKKNDTPTEIRCTGLGRPTKDVAYLSITRMDGTTERFNLTPSIARLYSLAFVKLLSDWGNVDDD